MRHTSKNSTAHRLRNTDTWRYFEPSTSWHHNHFIYYDSARRRTIWVLNWHEKHTLQNPLSHSLWLWRHLRITLSSSGQPHSFLACMFSALVFLEFVQDLGQIREGQCNVVKMKVNSDKCICSTWWESSWQINWFWKEHLFWQINHANDWK